MCANGGVGCLWGEGEGGEEEREGIGGYWAMCVGMVGWLRESGEGVASEAWL